MSQKKYIQSIQRASMILHCIADRGSAKLNEISEVTGLKTSTAFGILQTLEQVGQITRTNNGLEYTLGLNSLKFGLSYMNGSGVSDKIHDILVKLVKETNESAYFALQVGSRYYFLDIVLSPHPLRVVPGDDGFIDLPEKSALGKVFFSEDEKLEYATDMEEVYQGMNCMGIPYRTNGSIVGCVALTGPSHRFDKSKIEAAYSAYLEIMKEFDLEQHI